MPLSLLTCKPRGRPCLPHCAWLQEREPWEGLRATTYWLDFTSGTLLQLLTLAHTLHVWCAAAAGWSLHVRQGACACDIFSPHGKQRGCAELAPLSVACRWLHGLHVEVMNGVIALECRWMLDALQQRLRAHARYCRLQRQLRHCFADATPGTLAEAGRCPICLEGFSKARGPGLLAS